MPNSSKPAATSKRSSTVDIYTRIKRMITSFELYPGARITEQELADLFAVSRTPIREAIQRLEVEGYLTVRPKQGCFIRELDINELAEYYEVRIALELLIVEYACNNMPDKAIEQCMRAWRPGVHDQDVANGIDLGEKDEAFHVELATASGKPVMAEMLRNINNRIRIIRRLDLNTDNRSVRTYLEHHEILQHILQRDASKAKNLMKRHIQRSREFAKTLTLTALARSKSRGATRLAE